MLVKYARSEAFLEVKMASERIPSSYPGEAFSKFAALEDSNTEDGMLYVRTRAISSRVNKNNDGWPSEELAKSYKTFVGRPVFVDHNNSDPKRTRGVIVDAKLHVEDDKTASLDPYYASAPANHLPHTWVEILIEVDAKTYPKLAKAIKNGWVDATSMGANIDRSICSVCANEATSPSEYCNHIKQKGATFEITADNGEKVQKKSYEDCYGVNFFEDSFVFDPADETALNLGVDTKPMKLAEYTDPDAYYDHQVERWDNRDKTAPSSGIEQCPNCLNDNLMNTQNGYICPTCNSEFDANLRPVSLSHGHGDFTKFPPYKNPDISNWEGEGGAVYEDRNGGQTQGVRSATSDPGEYCDKCKIKLDKESIDGGRCTNCGAMLTSIPKQNHDTHTASWYSCQECSTLLSDGDSECPKCGGKPMKHEGPGNMPEQPGKRGSYNALIKVADGYHAGCRDCGSHMINVQDDNEGFLYCPKCDRSESNLSTLAPFLEHVTAEYKYVKQRGDKWVIVQKGTGKVLSTHDSQEQAEAAFRAMETHMHEGKTAEFGMGGQGVDKERVLNYEPQSDMVKAPAKVDTLQDDIECPNCHSDYLQADPDGILRCPTCSYEQPPTGLDNPDLGAAQRENDKDLSGKADGEQGGSPTVRAGEEDMDLGPGADSTETKNDNFIQPIKPLQAATKDIVTTERISEMIWKSRIQTNSAAEANELLPRTAASVEIPIEYPGGIHFGTHAAFQKHGLNATVHYPGAPQPLPIPGNAMQHFMMQMNAQKAQGLDNPGQVVVRLDAPDDQLDQAIKLIHGGGEGNPEHQASTIKQQPKKEVLVPQPDKPQETVESDQFAPVTSDRRVIKREETPEGHRTEQIIEETGDLLSDGPKDEEKEDEKKEDKSEESKSNEDESSESDSESKDKSDNTPDFLKKKEPVAASVEKDSATRVLEALAVAEEYVDAGLLPKEQKLAFVGQLEYSSDEVLATWRAALALTKSATTTSRRVSHTSRALPRLGSVTRTVPAINGTTSLDEVPLEAIFLQ